MTQPTRVVSTSKPTVIQPERLTQLHGSGGETYPVTIEMPGLGRIVGHTEFDQAGRMTGFALTAQVFLSEAWWDVVQIDTCGDHADAHYQYRTRDYQDHELVLPIRIPDDVNRAYDQAKTFLVTCWTENVVRWRSGC